MCFTIKKKAQFCALSGAISRVIFIKLHKRSYYLRIFRVTVYSCEIIFHLLLYSCRVPKVRFMTRFSEKSLTTRFTARSWSYRNESNLLIGLNSPSLGESTRRVAGRQTGCESRSWTGGHEECRHRDWKCSLKCAHQLLHAGFALRLTKRILGERVRR